jgi:N-methylhydantoinase B
MLEHAGGTADREIALLKAGSERLMRAHIDSIPDGTYSATAIVDSDGIVDRPLEVVLDVTVSGSDIHFDLSRSSPPCSGPMNSVWATTQSAVYVAMKHIFPDVPINAGCFAPIHIAPPDGTFLYARYPRPVAGCAAEGLSRLNPRVAPPIQSR